jgi:flavin reductase (DIM6/NTAB) family NADH-FMN oxidoreductase RutF
MEKIKEFGTMTEPCKKISGVIFTAAVANFECRLVGELPTGDHAIFVGEVVQGWTNMERHKDRLYTLGTGYKMGSVTSNLEVEYSPSLFKK